MTEPAPRVRTGLRVEMPDGIRLATDVYRPGHGRPAPAVLLRTYLGRGQNLQEGLAWAREGFAFVAQDLRGRYDSEGEWQPCLHEREDGAAAVAWVAEQPWCDGRVVVTGGSYAAFTAWTAALGGHPALAAVVTTAPAMRRTHFDPGGVLKLYNHAYWWTAHGDARVERKGLFEAMLQAEPDLLRYLPVTGLPERFWAEMPSWTGEVLAGPDAPKPWAVRDEELAALPLPTLHVGGWYDPFVRGTLHQFRTAGSARSPRPARSLVLGPWTHAFRTGEPSRYGARDHGESSRFSLGRWMSHRLGRLLGLDIGARRPDGRDDRERPDDDGPPVRIFLAGADRWLQGEGWPPHPVERRAWFAAGSSGRGRLVEGEPPAAEGADGFVYDPCDPFPARSGPVDQSDLAGRPDAVRYATGPLPAPVTILGEPLAVLWASSDAPGTDWVVRLHEELPDGRTIYLGHGLVDAARATGSPLLSGEARRYEIPLPPLALTIPAGHGLCLEITSSTFPEHARNLNTGLCRYTTAETRIARQAIHHGPATPTALILPAEAS